MLCDLINAAPASNLQGLHLMLGHPFGGGAGQI